MATSYNWIVIFSPHDGETVNVMKVIDAWASNSSAVHEAINVMLRQENQERYFKEHGEGKLRVALINKQAYWL